ncbi:MAG: hypothetical protein CMA64_00190 [Euryarchaeota archaeon]|jgi:hypothetical protein|nr:hypothetical protein [Euryarchaeota archaeon]
MGWLSGTEWAVKSTLENEKSRIDSMDPKELDLNPDEIVVVKKYIDNRLEDLNTKLKGNRK